MFEVGSRFRHLASSDPNSQNYYHFDISRHQLQFTLLSTIPTLRNFIRSCCKRLKESIIYSWLLRTPMEESSHFGNEHGDSWYHDCFASRCAFTWQPQTFGLFPIWPSGTLQGLDKMSWKDRRSQTRPRYTSVCRTSYPKSCNCSMSLIHAYTPQKTILDLLHEGIQIDL